MSHLGLMALHALLVATFFAFLVHDEGRHRLKLFGIIFGAMMLGALALAWILYPYPVQGTP